MRKKGIIKALLLKFFKEKPSVVISEDEDKDSIVSIFGNMNDMIYRLSLPDGKFEFVMIKGILSLYKLLYE